MRAAIYVRVSTEEQVDNTSLDDQERACRVYALNRGWSVVEVYREEGFTGTQGSRPKWDLLMASAQRGEIDVVVALSLSRVARNTLVGLTIAAELEQLNVGLAVTDMELDTTSLQGRFMRHLGLALAEMDRDQVVGRMRAGGYAKARRGQWPSSASALPYGFGLEGQGRTNRVVHIEAEVEMLRRVVGWFVDEPGTTTGTAVTRMTALGYRHRKGGLWTPQNLRRVLTSRSLVGELWWGQPKRSASHGSQHQRTRARNGTYPGQEPVLIQVEPVIESARFDALQSVLAAKAYGSQGPRGTFPLAKRLQSPCGGYYGGISQAGRKRVYRCRFHRWDPSGRPQCDCPNLPAADIEARVWAEVCALFTDPFRLATLAVDYVESVAQVGSESGDELAEVRGRITDLTRRLETDLAELIRQGVPMAAVLLAQQQIESDLAALKSREAELATAPAGETPSVDVSGLDLLLDLAASVAGRLADMTLEDQMALIGLLQIEVRVLDQTPAPALHVSGSLPWGPVPSASEEPPPAVLRGGLPFALAT